MAIYITKGGQSIFDLAIQLYGDISQTFTLIADNPILGNITNDVPALLEIKFTPQNNIITNQISLRQIDVATIETLPIPDLAEREDMALKQVYVSKKNGVWSDPETWLQENDEGVLVNTNTFPNSIVTDVVLEDGFTVTLDIDEVHCRELFFDNTDDVTRLDMQNRILHIHDKITYFVNDYKNPDPPVGGGIDTLTFWLFTQGTLRFTNLHGFRPMVNPFVNAVRRMGPVIAEFAMLYNTDSNMEYSYRAGDIKITRDLTINAISRWSCDPIGDRASTAAVGTFTISNNAVFKGLRIISRANSGIFGPVSCASYTLEKGSEHIFDHTNPGIFAATINLDGKVTMEWLNNASTQFILSHLNAGVTYANAADIDTFSTLELQGDFTDFPTQVQQMQNDFVVNEFFILNDANFDANGNTLTYGTFCNLHYKGKDMTVGDEQPTSGAGVNIPKDLIVDGIVLTLAFNINIRGNIDLRNGGEINLNGFTVMENQP